MATSEEATLMALNQRLLESIASGDWATYAQLCAPDLTCLEPEALGQVVAGLDFHKFYFDLKKPGATPQNTMCGTNVRIMGEAAVLAYLRLTQYLDAQGVPHSREMEETRVWQKIGGTWKHVHFHRSAPAK